MKKIIALLLAAFMTVTAAAAEGGDGTATVTPGNEKMPVYVIKSGNGTSVMLMYTGGEFKSEKMGSGESGNFNVSSVLFKEDTNYLPFRYLLKKFEYKDMTGYVENDKDWSEKKSYLKMKTQEKELLSGYRMTAERLRLQFY